MITSNPTPYGSLHDFGVGVVDQGQGKFKLTLYPICDITSDEMTMLINTSSWGSKEAELAIYNPGVRGDDEERDRIILVTWDGNPVAYFKPYDDDGSDDLSFGAELTDDDLIYYSKTWQKIYVATCRAGEVGEGESSERRFVFLTPFKTVREKAEAKCFANRSHDPFNWAIIADESGYKVSIDGGRMRYPDGTYSEVEGGEFELNPEAETTIYLRYDDSGLIELTDAEGGSEGSEDGEDVVEAKVYTFAFKDVGGVSIPYLKTDYIHSPSYDMVGERVELWDTKYDIEEDELKVYVGAVGTPVVRWAYDNVSFEVDPATKTDGWVVLGDTGDIYVVVNMTSSQPIYARLTDSEPDLSSGEIGVRVLTVSGNKEVRTRRHFGPYLIPAYYDSVLDLWASSGKDDAFKSISKTKASTGEDDDYRVLQLYNFDDPEEAAVVDTEHEGWAAEKPLQKMLIRKESDDGGAELQYATFHPVPAGDSTNKRLVWDDTAGGWSVDEGDEEAAVKPVLFNGRVTERGVLEVYIGPANQPLIFFPYNNLVVQRNALTPLGWLSMGSTTGDIYVVVNFSDRTPVAKLTRTPPSPFGSIPSFGVKVGSFDGSEWKQVQWGPYFAPAMVDSRYGPSNASPPAGDFNSLSIIEKPAAYNKADIPILQLYRFDEDDYNKQLPTVGDNDFGDDTHEMLVRVDSGGVLKLEYARFHPVPAGDSTNNSLEWDNTAGGWKAVEKSEEDGLSEVAHEDSDSATLTGKGTSANKLKADVRVSPKTGNIVTIETGVDKGVYAPKTEMASTDSVSVGGSGTGVDPYKPSAIVSPAAGNALQDTAQGLYVAPGGEGGLVAVSTDDTSTVELSGDGTTGDPIEADVKISSTSGNQLTVDASGLYVPESGGNPLAVFPVTLSQTGGSAGNSSSGATFTYTVKDLSGVTLASGVNPTAGLYKRPSIGKMVAATAGLAFINGSTLVLTWVNEVPAVKKC